ncbi:hypothetical protein E4U17_001098 [Claviceps sp. LM77 group G4]|nr:hypothetical protein E4U17_001098 [Claviceps sp. LM77 group G4]KAG6052633.1 hypothetical protein E4U33_000441 [Claviceps sp. LM78 group G4]KAG6076756.1 hypothetical protein E4U16_002605 [Claviceps sp. LM84 group G4]
MPSHPSSGPSRPPSPSPSNLPPLPSSPVFSVASTAHPISQFNLPLPPAPRPSHAVLTQADLEASQHAYADLVASAKTYRIALAALSQAASQFGAALEACARLKEARAEPVAGPHARHAHAHAHAHGPNSSSSMTMAMAATSSSLRGICTADTLLSASGVHHLIANHQQILSETVYRSFEVPLLHDLDKWQTVIDDEEETYQAKIKAQSREVKRMEKEGLKLHKQRRRDVARFRAHLVDLTSKLDGLTILHADHSRALLRESQDTSARIVDASCSLVRAEVDIFESLARKGWTGGGLEDLLEMGTDLFANTDEHVIVSSVGGGGGSSTIVAASSAGVLDNSNNTHLHGHHSNNNSYSNGDSSNKLFSILPPKSILADATSAASSMRLGHSRGDSLLMDSERYQSLAALATEVKQRGGGAGADTDSVLSADFNKPRGARPFSPQPIRRIPADVTLESLAGMAGDERAGRLVEEEEKEEKGEKEEKEESSSESEMGARREGDAWGD